MKRMTHERNSGIKPGYWSPDKKEDLVQRLAAYENTGLEPEEIMWSMGWRNCELELPREYGSYLVTMTVAGYHRGELFVNWLDWDPEERMWLDDGGDIVEKDGVEVIAWMPLPDVFQEVGFSGKAGKE